MSIRDAETDTADAAQAKSDSVALILRVLATGCFWLLFFPVLIGAMTIPLAPMMVSHHRDQLRTPGTESYHDGARRGLISTVGNCLVRSSGVLLLVGFACITSWPRRRLQLVVFAGAIALTALHFALPLIHGSVIGAILTWVSLFYLLPLASAVLSGIALRLLMRQ